MSLLDRIVLPTLTIFGLGFLIACGGGGNSSTPPPSGGFSNTNFSGTYTFSISGSDGNGALSIAGSVTACGCSNGQITAGTVDVADASGATGPVALTSTGSGYKVNADGTGTLKLSLPLNPTVQFQFAFVLTDAAHGLISEYDQNGTGSGTIDLQPNAVTLATTPYAFSVSGADESDNSLALVGAFTLNSGGTITTGIADFNENASAATAQPLSGSISVGTGTTPGTATLTLGPTALHFDVYAIDATHLKLIATDAPTEVLIGDVFSQGTAAIPSGTLAFSMAGTIPSSSGNTSVYAVGGTLNSDGASALTGGAEDINLDGTVDGGGTSPFSFNGTFLANPSGSGRFQVSLSGFQGGTNFAAYPSTGGILMLEVEPSGTLNPGTTSGTMMAQNSPAGVVASAGYGMNLSGAIGGGGELDQIVQFNTSSSKLTGEIYDSTSGNSYGLGGGSSFTTGATGQVIINFNGNSEGALYYGIDGANSFALGIDSSDVSVGAIQQQGSPTSTADVAARHLGMIKAAVRAKEAKKKKQQ